MEIGKISSINGLSSSNKVDNDTQNLATSFIDYLKDALAKTNDLKLQSDEITNAFAAGRTDNIHDVMIASEKAGIAMDFVMQVRNKVLDAYNEIMRLQV